MKYLMPFLFLSLFITSCKKDGDTSPQSTTAKLRFKFKFDENQIRLDNLGNEVSVASGNAALTPDFNAMSAYFIELVPTKFTQIRAGEVVYEANTQTSEAGSSFETAVIFDEAIVSDEGAIFLEIPIKDIAPGAYEYLRASVTYQNADVRFNLKNLPAPLPSELNNQAGTFAGFIGFNSHINDLKVKQKTISVNADKTQGFWAFEPQLDPPYQDLYTTYINAEGVVTGQAPEGSTTVVNILEEFGVELPFGSCIVTGELENGLTITGNETEDITLTLSFSINKSFEWVDNNSNGEWDFDVQAQRVEQVVDMGLRGLKIFKN
jgi:hypothetical protein